MQTPMYASPQVPQMVATPYMTGPAQYMMAQQQNPGYYTPMGTMQINGPPISTPQPYMAPPYYPEPIPRRQGCCDGCCYDCNCCTYCLGMLASLCICCFCCGEEAEDCC